MKKQSTFTFLIDKDLKETFKRKCKSRDEDASKILRRFIRKYIEDQK